MNDLNTEQDEYAVAAERKAMDLSAQELVRDRILRSHQARAHQMDPNAPRGAVRKMKGVCSECDFQIGLEEKHSCNDTGCPIDGAAAFNADFEGDPR